MKIAFLADNQVDERSRLEEHDRVMDFIAHDLRERKVDLVLHGGDIYERRSTARERQSVVSFLRTVTLTTPVIVVAGNHEAAGEVEELSHIGDEHHKPIYTAERPAKFPFMGVEVACLPWPRRSALASWVGKPLGREELNAVGLDALRSILRGFAQSWRDFPGPKILLAHAMVRGSKQGPDQPIMPGQDFELGLEDLALAEAHVNLLGHIHMPQEFVHSNADDFRRGVSTPAYPPTIYAGSPRRTAYAAGELEPKGYVVLEFDGPRLVGWERVPTPATPMRLLEAEWVPGDGFAESIVDSDLPGAEIRFRYTVDSDHRAAAKEGAEKYRADFLAHGASEVKVEEVVRPRSTARLAAVAGDKPLAEKLGHLWDRDGVAADRRPRLLAMLAEIDGGQK